MENTERAVSSREERKKLKEQATSELNIVKEDAESREDRKKKPKKLRIRLIPIWLRVIIVLVLIVAFFMIGTMIGYGVIGNGKPTDVFNGETWTHIIEIIKGGTPAE